jgi:quercetin dioxygenase-like cupin family protein
MAEKNSAIFLPLKFFMNIKIIKTGIDPKPFLDQITENDWNWVSRQKGLGGDTNPYGFLPLIMAKVRRGEDPHDVDRQGRTQLYQKYTSVQKFWKEWNIEETGRAAFFRLKPGNRVHSHIDRGLYYQDKDRYHLSLAGTYEYTVGEEKMIVEPGTFFWFYNKIPHSAINVGEVDRVSLVFDVPHNKNNPHH